MSDNINRPNDQIEEKMKKKNEQIMKCFLLCFVFRFIGIMSLWTSNWCDCDTEMCQHNQHTYKNEFFCSSLFTQKRSNHNQHKNKHSTNIASIGMCLVYSTKVLFLFLRFVSVCVFFLSTFPRSPHHFSSADECFHWLVIASTSSYSTYELVLPFRSFCTLVDILGICETMEICNTIQMLEGRKQTEIHQFHWFPFHFSIFKPNKIVFCAPKFTFCLAFVIICYDFFLALYTKPPYAEHDRGKHSFFVVHHPLLFLFIFTFLWDS